ncbi:hypothetical protein BS78_05G233400 [Paspalum vaginatum]|nr:hypothetical protein BS78_05G233400 [Paspalum vaginatum]
MADPVVIVEKIIEISIGIKEAVETVKENKEECHGIEKLVRRVSDLLSLLKESEMMRHRVVGGSLEDLGNAVSRAREVVTACQGKNIVCLWCKAAKLAKKLSQVKNDISNWMMLAIFATNVTTFVATKGQQSPHPDLFLVRTYRPPPMSEHLPSSPRVVVQDLLPTSSLPTDGPASPSSPRQVPPSYAPVTYCSCSYFRTMFASTGISSTTTNNNIRSSIHKCSSSYVKEPISPSTQTTNTSSYWNSLQITNS